MLKKLLKWTFIILLFASCIATIVILSRQDLVYTSVRGPRIKAATDTAIINRGAYLAYGPAHCAQCHASPAKMDAVDAGAVVPLTGGQAFTLPWGRIYATNLTPEYNTGITKIKDTLLSRSLRHGVKYTSIAMFNIMHYQHMSDEDLQAVLSYLRTQQPVISRMPLNTYTASGMMMKAFRLQPIGPQREVPVHVQRDTTVAYGRYLANDVANCRGCHTQRDPITGLDTGPEYAGSNGYEENPNPSHALPAPNLTPHPTGVMHNWSAEQFVTRMGQGKLVKESHMPWGPYKRMTKEDLLAIYKYLKTTSPAHL